MKKKNDVLSEALALAATQRSEKRFPHLLGDLDKHGNIAMYYGFTPVRTPEVTKEDFAKAKIVADKYQIRPGMLSLLPEERIALLRTYQENGMDDLPQPVMMYYRHPFPGTGHRRNPHEAHCGLEVFGTTKSIAEALTIHAAYAMLSEEGFGNLVVELNSMGERDTMVRHERELCAYFRKHAASVPSSHRSIFKSCIFDILTLNDPECSSFRDAAPKSVNFLSESSRRHFMEVLEYLDILDVPYRINHALIWPRNYHTHTIFEIRSFSDETRPVTLAFGARYNYLSRRLGFKKELPAVGATIIHRRPTVEIPWKPVTNPKFYLIQLGPDARLKAVKVIDMLRREKIAVHHSLTREKLVSQIDAAEHLKVPYLLIIGQKEALEDTIVVRNLNTRAQETVNLKDLVFYLKKIR